MIYEVRSYRVEPHDIPEFERRFGAGYLDREHFSPLTGFWRTENQRDSEVVHVWPYADQVDRMQRRAEAAQHPNWPPATGSFVSRMMAELVIPYPFVKPPTPGQIGPVFELRYDYFRVADLRAANTAWQPAIQERSLSQTLVLAGTVEFGQTNGIVQMWAYADQELRDAAHLQSWVPANGPTPTSIVIKALSAAAFSPLQ